MNPHRLLSYRTLLHNAAAAAGLNVDAGELTTAAAISMTRHMNAALRYVWTVHPWEETIRVVQSLDAVPPGVRLLNVFSEDPAEAREQGWKPDLVEWHTGTRGGVVLKDAPTEVWYEVQDAVPRMGYSAYNAATVYNSGDSLYEIASGHCFVCITDGTSAVEPIADDFSAWTNSGSVLSGTVSLHNGLLWLALSTHTSGDSKEPGVGADWATYWQLYPWQFCKVPECMEAPVLDAMAALAAGRSDGQLSAERVIRGAANEWLEDEIRRRTYSVERD